MGTKIRVFTNTAYRDYELPDIYEGSYFIRIANKLFDLENDIKLELQAFEGRWRIKDKDINLKNDEATTVSINNEQMLSFILTDIKEILPVYSKYIVTNENIIGIGSNSTNNIRYQFYNCIRDNHARIKKNNDEWCIVPIDGACIYVNNELITQTRVLAYGDKISTYGLDMVILNNVICIRDITGNVLPEYIIDNENQVNENKLSDNKKSIYLYISLKEYTKDSYYKRCNIDESLKSFCIEGPKISEREEKKRKKKDFSNVEFKRAPKFVINEEYESISKDKRIDVFDSDYIDNIDDNEQDSEYPPIILHNRNFAQMIKPAIIYSTPMITVIVMFMLIFGILTFYGNAIGIFFMVLLPVLLFITVIVLFKALLLMLTVNKQVEVKSQESLSRHNDTIDRRNKAVYEMFASESRTLMNRYPSISRCARYSHRNNVLWGRYFKQEDFMVHRVGYGLIGDMPEFKELLKSENMSDMSGGMKKKLATSFTVPVCIDMDKYRIIGISGKKSKEIAERILYALVGQIAANNCYTDVKMAFAYSKQYSDWSAMRWFPHTWDDDMQDRFMADDTKSSMQLCGTLIHNIKKCMSDSNNCIRYVLFVSDKKLIDKTEIIDYAIKSKGLLSIVVLSESYDNLPKECEIIIQKRTFVDKIYYFDKKIVVESALEGISLDKIGRMAVRLSRISVNEKGFHKPIASEVSFMQMYKVSDVKGLEIKKKWENNDITQGIEAVLGTGRGGRQISVDISDRKHGPHGLIAGMTGTGKTELIRTFILSLAVNYSPRVLNFMLIDYKGGELNRYVEGLPHVCASINNLQTDDISRAITTLKSEMLRRQKILAEYGLKSVDELIKEFYKDKNIEVLPHLVIIVDEFAELKSEDPEFMNEMISIARKGRSLGMHLILATQKPHGNVDTNIMSNMKFVVCLGVKSEEDSKDVLNKKDAAYIISVGRAFLQVGVDEIYDEFQTGWSGANYSENYNEDNICLIGLQGQHIYAGRKKGKRENPTQLMAILDEINRVSEDYNFVQKRLWMEELPSRLLWGKDINNDEVYSCCSISTTIGISDDVKNQRRYNTDINFTNDGHLVICGNPGTGKSVLLQTLIYGLSKRYTHEDIEIDIVDCGNGNLRVFAESDIVNSVISDERCDDISYFTEVFEDIEDKLINRKKLLSGESYSEYLKKININGKTQENKDRIKIPAYIICINNYVTFRELTRDCFEDNIAKIAREGSRYGIYLVITTIKNGGDGLQNRIHELMERVICMYMGEKHNYYTAFRINDIETLPKNVPGRGIIIQNNEILEFQTATIGSTEGDKERLEFIKKQQIGG